MENPKKIGRYEILEELGRGAMGTVYRAKDPAMDRVVALKTISAALVGQNDKEFRERFTREARAAGALTHPGIVPVFDVGEHEGMPFLVMEFVSGRTLADTVRKGEALTMERVSEIGQKIADALGYAHQHGVVHRDIKPANILLTSREAHGIERPKITDFGVAKVAEGHTTLTGQIVGTPAFMSPEQFTGLPVDGRADIFSLGVLLYWMATREQPFPGESMTSVSYKVVHTEPVPPRKLSPSVPAKLEGIILKCLAKSPEERYQTGEELARDLGELRSGAKGTTFRSAMPPVTASSDPDATLIAAAPAAAVKPVAQQLPSPSAQSEDTIGGKRDAKLMLMAPIVALVLLALVGGWYVLRSRHKATVETAPSAETAINTSPAPDAPAAAAAPVAAPDGAPPLAASEPAATGNIANAGAAALVSKASPAAAKAAPATKKAPAPTEPPSETPATKAVDEPKPAVDASVGFDPRKLDPKQDARLKIDAEQMPGTLDFTVEMNGKVYFQKIGAASLGQDDGFFVPPGVQEFRVIAKSNGVAKESNTVSTEFKAKKRNTLKVELRTEGMPAGAGVPQDLYPNTQIVLTLK